MRIHYLMLKYFHMFTKEWYLTNEHPRSMLGKKHSKKTRDKMSKQRKGRKLTDDWKRNIGLSHIGKKRSEETKLKISKTKKANYASGKTKPRCGEDNNLWNGGKSSKNKILRNRKEYRLWREKVFKKNDYICQNCGQKGGYLQAHHIIPIAVNPNKIYDVKNGLTLCLKCHELTDSYLNNKIGRDK